MDNTTIINKGGITMDLLQIRRNFQITLPSKLRQLLNLKEGDLMEAKIINQQAIILKPKVVVNKGRNFSNQEINNWLKDDKLDNKTLATAQELINSKK